MVIILSFLLISLENLTKEEYSGEFRNKLPYNSASANALNPKIAH